LYKIVYDIKFEENGRPYIVLLNDSGNATEDRFLAVELTRYITEQVYVKRTINFDEESSNLIKNSIGLLY
jgi:hypothetical protein